MSNHWLRANGDQEYVESITAQSNRKESITTVKKAIKDCLQYHFENNKPITESNPLLTPLCQHIEAFIAHKFKVKIINSTTFSLWKIVLMLPHLKYDHAGNHQRVIKWQEEFEYIKSLSEVSTDIGKLRAFIRRCLNEATLNIAINIITTNQEILKHHYDDDSILRFKDDADLFRLMLVPLETIPFQIDYNDATLDAIYYESPSPLASPQTSPALSYVSTSNSNNLVATTGPAKKKKIKSLTRVIDLNGGDGGEAVVESEQTSADTIARGKNSTTTTTTIVDEKTGKTKIIKKIKITKKVLKSSVDNTNGNGASNGNGSLTLNGSSNGTSPLLQSSSDMDTPTTPPPPTTPTTSSQSDWPAPVDLNLRESSDSSNGGGSRENSGFRNASIIGSELLAKVQNISLPDFSSKFSSLFTSNKSLPVPSTITEESEGELRQDEEQQPVVESTTTPVSTTMDEVNEQSAQDTIITNDEPSLLINQDSEQSTTMEQQSLTTETLQDNFDEPEVVQVESISHSIEQSDVAALELVQDNQSEHVEEEPATVEQPIDDISVPTVTVTEDIIEEETASEVMIVSEDSPSIEISSTTDGNQDNEQQEDIKHEVEEVEEVEVEPSSHGPIKHEDEPDAPMTTTVEEPIEQQVDNVPLDEETVVEEAISTIIVTDTSLEDVGDTAPTIVTQEVLVQQESQIKSSTDSAEFNELLNKIEHLDDSDFSNGVTPTQTVPPSPEIVAIISEPTTPSPSPSASIEINHIIDDNNNNNVVVEAPVLALTEEPKSEPSNELSLEEEVAAYERRQREASPGVVGLNGTSITLSSNIISMEEQQFLLDQVDRMESLLSQRDEMIEEDTIRKERTNSSLPIMEIPSLSHSQDDQHQDMEAIPSDRYSTFSAHFTPANNSSEGHSMTDDIENLDEMEPTDDTPSARRHDMFVVINDYMDDEQLTAVASTTAERRRSSSSASSSSSSTSSSPNYITQPPPQQHSGAIIEEIELPHNYAHTSSSNPYIMNDSAPPVIPPIPDPKTFKWAPLRRKLYFNIPVQLTIKHQGNMCAGCSRDLSGYFTTSRYCEYSGKFFCTNCHNKTQWYIPARIITNWDFKQYPVANFSYAFLMDIARVPLFDIATINPRLYRNNQLLRMRNLRRQMYFLKDFLKSCTADGPSLLGMLHSNDYLASDVDFYSLADLVHYKQLLESLRAIVARWLNHVESCPLCQAKGSYCEFCDSKETIYPYNIAKVTQCKSCQSIHHKDCFDKNKCPKCLRVAKRKILQNFEKARIMERDSKMSNVI
ncbi:hypothetical protein SAMD00019534_044620 [Acytostelium subglobosum LB1]|uniref:hypothetical protein n=1 Tax=Acytostelium subglobosum LB1 TaxID=1410327 RepID=UPI00064495D2|nr:hypothetical protein SAMD00019534_044620 [Acytostelium subglobosum LB1]GAM21287.1 hypothetical protein SAMD00019534_044620 [Acytostelium subglobosum LB1]|eukprot:XP_012755406.1 hypothetical protein SAMD00019534_044620 [Acytostelium subglobosum LB1]